MTKPSADNSSSTPDAEAPAPARRITPPRGVSIEYVNALRASGARESFIEALQRAVENDSKRDG